MVELRASQRRLGRMKTDKGMVLPFQPLSMAFSNVYYSVDLPAVRQNIIFLDGCKLVPKFWLSRSQSCSIRGIPHCHNQSIFLCLDGCSKCWQEGASVTVKISTILLGTQL
jgi:hypothetical protein